MIHPRAWSALRLPRLSRRRLLILLFPALLLALLWQGMAAQPAAAQSGALTCGAPVPILAVVGNSYSSEPVLNEDGSMAVFWSTANPSAATSNADGNIEVFAADLTLTAANFNPQFRQLTLSSGSILGGFNLAPDLDGEGRFVVFFSDRDLVTGQNSDANFEIFRLDRSNGQILQVTNTVRGSNLFPSISADGRLIAFTSDIDLESGGASGSEAGRNLEVFVANLANPTAITFDQVTNTILGRHNNEDPVLSGDGSTLAFVSDFDGNSEIYLYDVGSNAAPVNVTNRANGVSAHPSLNFDGSRLVFLSDQALEAGKTTGGNPQVFLFPNPLTGNGFFQVTQGSSHGHPTIDGVGNRISFQRITGSQEDIILYDVANRSERQISVSAAGRTRLNPSISRNGTVIAYEDTGAIFVVNCPIADLGLSVDGPTSAIAGLSATYLWTVTNGGTSGAAGVEVRGTFPTGFSLNTTTASPECSQSNREIVCALPLLNVGETRALTLPVNLAPNLLGTAAITVETLSRNVTDPALANNQRTLSTLIDAEADLRLSQPVTTVVAPLVGEPITYTLVLSNVGPSVARNVRITDTLPTEVTFVSAAGCTQQQGIVTCDVAGEFAPGSVLTRTIVARVSALNETAIVNDAIVGSITRDPVPANNRSIRTDRINTTFDLAVTQRTEPELLRSGAPVTYTFTITNLGPSIAAAVELSVTLPPQFTPATNAQGRPTFCTTFTCLPGIDTTRPFTVGLGTLGRETVNVVIPGRIDAAFSGQINSSATVYSAEEPLADRNLSNNDTSAVNDVFQEADLTIESIDLRSEVVAGAPVTYVITALNNGPSVANNTVLTFTIEPGVTLTGLDVNLGVCSGSSLVTCVLDVLSPTQRLVVTATGALDPALTGSLTTSAGVRSDTADLTPDFDTRVRVDGIEIRAELTLRNQPSALQAVSGQDNLLFDLVVTNLGPSLARTVVLTNVLPISTTANQIFLPNGVVCGPLARTIVCDIGDLGAATPVTVTVRAGVNADAVGTLINRATVDSDITDPLSVDSAAVTTIQRADLRVNKTAAVGDRNNNGLPDVGERITYTVVLSNAGPSNANGIVITDEIPAVLGTVLSLPAQGSFDPNNSLWTVGALAAGRPTTLTVSALLNDATSGQVITNTAAIQSANQPDPVTNNNRSSVTFAVSLAADLAVDMAVSNPTPQVLDQISYQITVTNNGPEDATGVEVTDVLPPALTYLSHTPGTANYTTTTGIWQVGNLAVGQSQSLTLNVRVVGSGNIANSASVTGDLIDPDPANNTATAPITVGLAADLRLTQSFSDETPNVDDDLIIVLTLSNDGPDTAENISVSYPVPALLLGAAVSTEGSATYSAGSGLWTVPLLASGASTTLTVRRTLDRSGSFSSVGEIVSSSLFDPDSTPGNGTANGEDDATRVTVTVPPAADVEVLKSVNPGPFKEGDTVSYTLLVRNNGPDTATNVVVTETLPVTLLNVLLPTVLIAGDDLNDSSFAYFPTAVPGIITGTLSWDVGTLVSGDTETLFLSLTVQPNTAGRTIADGTDGLAADQYDWRPGNNLSNVIAIVIDGADLNVTKTVSNDRPNVDETLVYTLTVTNNGPTDTTNVNVVDQLPAGLTYVDSLSTPSGSYDNLSGAWTIPALANQETATLLITTTVNPGLVNQVITNTVSAATSDVADGDQSNNTPSVVISVQQADLRVSIQTPNPTPFEREITTFFIVVENQGPDIATSVVLTHALPISLTNRGGAPTQGVYTLAANRWNIGTLPVGASARLSFFAEPNPGTGGQTIALTIADLTLDQEDPLPDISASGVITVIGSDLRIPQIAISDDTPATGNQVRYTATVENLGPSANPSVILTQTVPAGTTFVAAQSGATVIGNNVRWTLSLAAGASATRAMTVTVNAAAGTDLIASAVTASGVVTTPDNFPLNNGNSLTVTVNQPPLITLATLPTVNEGSILNVNGVFTDTDSPSVLSAQVNYGDGSATETLTLNQTPSGSSVTGSFALSHRYVDGGNYTVAITMTDSDNNVGSFAQVVTIQNVAPTVTPRANITSGVLEGSSASVNDLVTFTDPGYSALNTSETFTYTIDWGDGSDFDSGVVTDVTNGSAGVATTGALDGSHTYADNGVYTVNVTIEDDDGGSNSASFTITVTNVPPTVTATTNRSVAEAAQLSITNLATFSDPAWTDADRGSNETFTYSINWGDGSTPSTGTATVDANGSLGVLTQGSLDGVHVYADDDDSPYTVTVTVTDDDGGSNQAQFQVTVTNVNPTITAIAANQAITEGLPLTISNVISFSDPGFTAFATSETFTYSIDLGDGSALVTGSVVNTVTNGAFGTPTVGTFDVTLTYGNDDDGRPYTTTVTLFDDNGGSASGTFRVAVANTNPTVDLVGPQTVDENPTLVHTYNFTVTDTGIGSEVYSIVGSPNCGTGTLTGTPTINPTNGIGNFQCIFPDGTSNTFVSIRVSDGTANDVTTVLVTVNNLDPIVVNDTDSTDEDTPVVITVLANDSDVPADTVTIGSAGTPLTGTVTVAGNALSLTYDPNGALESLAVGSSQAVTFTYTAVDEDGGSATGTVTVTVNGVNDAPIVGGSVNTTGLNDNVGATAIFGGVSVDDVDTGETLTLTIQLSNAAAGTIGGGGFTAQGGGLFRVTGLTVAAANTALDSAVFTPTNNSGASGTFNTTFTVTATDSQAAADSITSAALTITRVNDTPTITGVLTTLALNDNAGATAIFGNMVVADVDTGETVTLEIQLSNAAAGTISGGGFTAQGGGLYRVTGLSVANANTALDNATFTPTNNTASSGTFDTTFTLTVTDSQTASDDLTSGTLTITIQNDAPTLSGAVNTTSLSDSAGATAIFGGVTVADVDTGETVSLQIQVNTASAGTISGGGFVDQGGGIYLVSGLSVAAANTALDNVTFTPTDNTGASGSFSTTFTITVTDSQGAFDDITSSALTINVSNDAPVVTGTVTTTGLIDTDTAVAILGNVSVADADTGDTLTLDIQLSNAAAGTISGGGFTPQGGGLFRATGLTVAAANTALDNATFTPTNNSGPSGTFNTTFTVTATDSQAAADSITSAALTVTRINDAPTVTGSVTTTGLNDNAGATAIFGNVVIADVDTGDTLTLQIQLSNAAAGTISGGGFTDQGGGLYEVTGLSVVAANTALDNVTFTPANNTGTSGSFATTFTVTATDSQTASNSLTSGTLTITIINDTPVINNLAGNTLAYSEGAAAAVIDQGTAATVTDADAPDFDTGTLTVSFTAGSDSAEDVLAIRNQGVGAGQIGVSGADVTYGGVVIGTFVGGSGGANLVVTFNNAATPTSAGALIANITYQNSDTDNPTTGNRTVRFVISDGDGATSSNVDTTVSVSAVNDAPTLADVASPVIFLENTVNAAAQVIDNDVTLADVDSANFSGGNVTVSYTSGAAAQDQLSVNNQGNGAGQIGVSGSTVSFGGTQIGTIDGTSNGVNGVTLLITLNANASVTAVDALIQNLAYANTSDAPNASRTVQITVNDGDGGTSSAVSVQIDVTGENDAPVINNLSGNTLAYTEGNAATVIDQAPLATVTDADSANFATGTLAVAVVAGGDTTEDVLSIRNQGNGAGQIGVSGSNVNFAGVLIGTFTGGSSGNDLVVTLNNAATPTAVGALIANITYRNADTTNPTTTNRTVRFVVSDGDGGTSSVVDTTVTVTRVNSAPTFTGLAASITVLENTANTTPTILDGTIVFGDADGGDFNGGSLTVSYTSGGGAQNQIGVNNQGTADGQISVSGSNVSYTVLGVTSVIGVIDVTNNGSNGQSLLITFNANSSVAAVDALIQNLTYANTSDTPTSARTIQIAINDGSGAGNATVSDSLNVFVTSENDAPVLDSSQTPPLSTIAEDVGSGNVANPGTTVATLVVDGSITDPDGTAVEAIAVIAVDDTNGDWQYSSNGLSWSSFSASSGVVNIEATARLLSSTYRVRFVPNADYNGSASITFRAWDTSTGTAGNTANATTNGGATAFSSASDTADITITAVNDVPTLTGVTSPVTFLENTVNATAQVIDNDVTFGDVDSTDLNGGNVTVSYSTGDAAQDQLSVRNEGNGAGQIGVAGNAVSYGGTQIGTIDGTSNGVNGASLLITLNASADVTAVDALIQNLTYTNASDTPNASRTIAITVNDGDGGTSTAVNVVINVTAQNDNPVLTNNTTRVVASGSSGNVISNAQLLVSDADNTPAQLILTVTVLPTQGDLKRSGVQLVLNGTFTQQDINDGLITYDHTAGDSNDDQFTFTVSDGAGGTIGGTIFTIQVDGVGALNVPGTGDAPLSLFLPLIQAGDTPTQRGLGGE